MGKNQNQQSANSYPGADDSVNIFGMMDKQLYQVEKGTAPLVESYDDHVRPLLDAIDSLRHLNVMKEGINLPTIVVVGDQSSGKSSVLESLAGINLPRGQGICTRVPLIMRLQDYTSDAPLMHLEYLSTTVETTEESISDAISSATEEIVGHNKEISNTPITLVVRKKGVPDLTMVDLPGITRVPVHGQPDNIYEQISEIIMDYITPKESIILNVLSASVDFPTCESIRMSQRVDKSGERTIAVVTKSDRSPEGLLEKVTTDAVNIGLGYVCVRNRIGEETYREARAEEALLFETHPLLSKIDKSIVGIPVLARKLVKIQAASIARCLPGIVKNIKDKLEQNMNELENLPRTLSDINDVMTVMFQIIGAAKDSLKKLLLQGDFEEYPDDPFMHGTARMAKMMTEWSETLSNTSSLSSSSSSKEFLEEQIQTLEESVGFVLPNFIPRTAFNHLLCNKLDHIQYLPVDLINHMWDYIQQVVRRVLVKHADSYSQIKSITVRSVDNVIEELRKTSQNWVREMMEMERGINYTCNPLYKSTCDDLLEPKKCLMEAIRGSLNYINLKGMGDVKVGHLRQRSALVEEAFDLKVRIDAYWKIVEMRLVDNLAMHLVHSVEKLVCKKLPAKILEEAMRLNQGGIDKILEEPTSIASKRERLNRSVKLLKQSKEVVANIMDKFLADS